MKYLITLLLTLSLLSCAAKIPHNSIYRIDLVADDHGALVQIGNGSGFAVGEHLIMTAAHVCRAAVELAAELRYGSMQATIVKMDLEKDLCLLRTDETLKHWLRLSNSEPQLDDILTVVGYPLGTPAQIVTKGPIAGVVLVAKTARYLISCPSYHGNSGGPILNDSGEVVGVLIAGSELYPLLAISVTLTDIRAFLGVP